MYINDNLKKYLLLTIIFFIGISIGVIAINNMDTSSQEKINEYIVNFTNTIKENKLVSKSEIMKQIMEKECILLLIITLLGLTVIGLPFIYLVVLCRGFCLSFTIALIFASLKFMPSILIMLIIFIPYLIYIPVIFTTAVNSENLYGKISKNNEANSLKTYIIKTMIFLVLMVALVAISALLETNLFTLILPIVNKFC